MAGHYPYVHGSPFYMGGGQPVYPQEGFIAGLQPYPTLPPDHRGYAEFEDSSRGVYSPTNSGRNRRRAGIGGEHVKHRRTRSGCFTCRHRRVKCDETHPVCDRCRKGNRECKWPDPTTATKARRSSRSKVSSEKGSGSSGEDAEHEDEDAEGLPTIQDEDHTADENSRTQADSGDVWMFSCLRAGSDTPSLTYEKSPTPSTEGSSIAAFTPVTSSRPPLIYASPTSGVDQSERWAQLPSDLKFYLDYHRREMNFNHYAFLFDATFLKTTFLEIALHHQPLLHSIAGFAAYHHAVSKGDGLIEDFLRYYTQSLTLLRQSLQQSKKHSNATLLTILQLASTEEFLGDWVNLMSHQRAALKIITELYTPETIMQNNTLRVIITWYIRFDLYAGILSGNGACLGPEWFEAYYDYYLQQTKAHPNDLKCLFEERFAFQRLMAVRVGIVSARLAKGSLSGEEFERVVADLGKRIHGWEADLHPSMTDPSKLINDFTDAPPLEPGEPFNPYEPGILYSDELFPMNFLRMNMWSVQLLWERHIAEAQKIPFPRKLYPLVMDTFKLFVAMERCPQSPPGTVLGIHAGFAVAAVAIKTNGPDINWIRKKMAQVEAMGYNYPRMFRCQLGDSLGIDVSHWWLPHDEDFPPMMRAVRQFVAERATTPRTPAAEDLHSLRGIFGNLSLGDDHKSEEGGETTTPGLVGPEHHR